MVLAQAMGVGVKPEIGRQRAKHREAIVRFDVRAILVLMAFVALACAAFATGAQGWVYVFDGLTLLLLGGSLIAAVVSHESRRAFWFAFFVFATLYLATTYNSLKFLGIDDGLPTNKWVYGIVHQVYPPMGEPTSFSGTTPFYLHDPRASVTSQVAHQSIAILVGIVAAYVSRAMYVISERRRKGRRAAEGGDGTARRD